MSRRCADERKAERQGTRPLPCPVPETRHLLRLRCAELRHMRMAEARRRALASPWRKARRPIVGSRVSGARQQAVLEDGGARLMTEVAHGSPCPCGSRLWAVVSRQGERIAPPCTIRLCTCSSSAPAPSWSSGPTAGRSGSSGTGRRAALLRWREKALDCHAVA